MSPRMLFSFSSLPFHSPSSISSSSTLLSSSLVSSFFHPPDTIFNEKIRTEVYWPPSVVLCASCCLLFCCAGGRELPSTERQKVYENGTLVVSEASRELDEGVYVCRASNDQGEHFTRSIHIQVLSKWSILEYYIIITLFGVWEMTPKNSSTNLPFVDCIHIHPNFSLSLSSTFHFFHLIFRSNPFSFISWAEKPSISPFRFPATLTEGMSVITTCSILTGDPPIHVDWFKDSQPLDLGTLNVHRNEMGDLGSSLVFRSVGQSHAGNYTCLARNRVGEDSYTAPMIVKSKSVLFSVPFRPLLFFYILKSKSVLFSVSFRPPTSILLHSNRLYLKRRKETWKFTFLLPSHLINKQWQDSNKKIGDV